MGCHLVSSHVTPHLEVHVPTSVPPHLGGKRTPYDTLADGLFAHAEQVGRLPHSHPLGCQPVTPTSPPASLYCMGGHPTRFGATSKASSMNPRATEGSLRSCTSCSS